MLVDDGEKAFQKSFLNNPIFIAASNIGFEQIIRRDHWQSRYAIASSWAGRLSSYIFQERSSEYDLLSQV